MISQDVERELTIAERARPRTGWRRWAGFLLVGLALYCLLYAASERLVMQHGQRSRLFMIATAPEHPYDFVVLGASHALPLDFGDMNQRLEKASGGRILNLGVEGGGIVPARFLLDYFLARHQTGAVVLVLDSFAYYSRQWNEDRINDPKLLLRAPFDPDLAVRLWRLPATRPLLPGYLSGFYKINNADRTEPDISDTERTKFSRVYRTNANLDRQRLAYLYPDKVDEAALERYLGELDALLRELSARKIKLVVIKTPLPGRVLGALKGEEAFDARVRALFEPRGIAVHDFTHEANEDKFFYDTDHLNKDGASNFIDTLLGPLLKAERDGPAAS